MEMEEKKYWVGFNVFEGIGPMRFRLMKDYFGTAALAFGAAEKSLREIGLSQNLLLKFLSFRKSFDFDSYFLRLKRLGIEVVCSEEESYPKLLKEIENYPPVLYLKAKNSELIGKVFKKKALAVVGTRMISPYGRKVTQRLTASLVKSGLVIVSGLARGVDRVAHEATLEAGGVTVAVFGTGLETIYPPEHKALAKKIVDGGGILVSEFGLGAKISKGNFPARNRIISGLCMGIVVTEAARDSGSLITASFAGQQGREVFAVPGPITSANFEGTSELIKKGAKLVYNVEDILEEL